MVGRFHVLWVEGHLPLKRGKGSFLWGGTAIAGFGAGSYLELYHREREKDVEIC